MTGVRYEDHTIDAYNHLPTGAIPATPTLGLAAIPGQPQGARMVDKRYYPSLNLKYSFTPNFDVRFGAAKSLGLPDYNQLVPSQPTITDPTPTVATGTISVFNRGLTPYTIYNYDLTAEYYFNPSGFVSASVYDKRFQNYLVTFTQGGHAGAGGPVRHQYRHAELEHQQLQHQLHDQHPGLERVLQRHRGGLQSDAVLAARAVQHGRRAGELQPPLHHRHPDEPGPE